MSKYRAIKTGIYASKKEAARAEQLKLLERSGHIINLREQVVYVLAPSVVIGGRKIPPVRYKADFVYVEYGNEVVEDVKGVQTPVYRLKRHLMKSVLGLDILET